MSQRRTLKLVTLAAATVATVIPISSTPASADPPACTATWVNTEGGRWAEAANWSTGIVPNYLDHVCIQPLQQEYSVLVDEPQAVASLRVARGVALILEGHPADEQSPATMAQFASLGDVLNEGTMLVDSSPRRVAAASLTVENGFRITNRGLLRFIGASELNGTVVNSVDGTIRVDDNVDNKDFFRPLGIENFGRIEFPAATWGIVRSQGGTITNRGVITGTGSFQTIGGAGVFNHATTGDNTVWADVVGGTLRLTGSGATIAWASSFPPVSNAAGAVIARVEGNVARRQELWIASAGATFPVRFTTDTVNNGLIKFVASSTQAVQVVSGRTLTNAGTMRVEGSDPRTISGRFLNNGAIVFDAAGSLTLDTATAFGPSSGLVLPIASPTSYATVRSTSSIALNGTLVGQFVDGFVPAYGQSFDLVRASRVTGRFSTVSMPTLTGGLRWQVTYGTNRVTATVTCTRVGGRCVSLGR